jgi:hypothetical protein
VSARKLGALSGVDTPLASPPPVELAVRGEPDTP